jgi:hypothetical protein
MKLEHLLAAGQGVVRLARLGCPIDDRRRHLELCLLKLRGRQLVPQWHEQQINEFLADSEFDIRPARRAIGKPDARVKHRILEQTCLDQIRRGNIQPEVNRLKRRTFQQRNLHRLIDRYFVRQHLPDGGIDLAIAIGDRLPANFLAHARLRDCFHVRKARIFRSRMTSGQKHG